MKQHVLSLTVLTALLALAASPALATGYYHPPDCDDCREMVLPDCYWTVGFKVSYYDEDYFGTIYYVDDALTGDGWEALAIDPVSFWGFDLTKAGLLGVTLDFKGETFTQCDDILYDEAPVIKFNDGEFVGLVFSFRDDGNTYGIVLDDLYKNFRDKGEVCYDEPVYSCAVPTPAAASAGLSLIGAMALRRRRAA